MSLTTLLPKNPFSLVDESGQQVFISFLNAVGFLDKPNSFSLSPENQAQHNISVETLAPLLPVGFTCFLSKRLEKDIQFDKMQAQLAGEEYVEPQPWLTLCLAKNREKALSETLSNMLSKSPNASEKA